MRRNGARVMGAVLAPCAHPEKKALASEMLARNYAALVGWTHAKEYRVYPCPCGSWHLTTQRVSGPYAVRVQEVVRALA